MANSLNFTKESLLALPLPEAGKRAVYLDKKTTGLQIRVTSTGAKPFQFFGALRTGNLNGLRLGAFLP